jgi:hypothetical protein
MRAVTQRLGIVRQVEHERGIDRTIDRLARQPVSPAARWQSVLQFGWSAIKAAETPIRDGLAGRFLCGLFAHWRALILRLVAQLHAKVLSSLGR